MYRCLKAFTSSVVAAAVFVAVAATPAFAVDPQEENCKGLGPGVKKIDLNVVPATAGSVSSFKGGALLCGSDLGPNPKGFKSGSIEMPWARKGSQNKNAADPNYVQLVQTRCANPQFYNTKGGNGKADCPAGSGPHSLKDGQYTGSVGMGISTGGGEIALDGALSKIYVQKAPGTPKGNTHCSAAAVACYQGTDGALGYADITVVKIPKVPGKTVLDTYELNIHEIVLMVPLPVEVYYTRIGYPEDGKPMDLCAYAGAVNGDACGDPASDDWVQKNGPVAEASCNVVDWMFMGFETSKYKGVGFIVTTTNNVPGADDWWATEGDYGPGWTENKERIAAAQQHKFDVPHCAPLTLDGSGAGKPGAGAGAKSADDGQKGASSDGRREGSKSDSSSQEKGSSHEQSSHHPFR